MATNATTKANVYLYCPAATGPVVLTAGIRFIGHDLICRNWHTRIRVDHRKKHMYDPALTFFPNMHGMNSAFKCLYNIILSVNHGHNIIHHFCKHLYFTSKILPSIILTTKCTYNYYAQNYASMYTYTYQPLVTELCHARILVS